MSIPTMTSSDRKRWWRLVRMARKAAFYPAEPVTAADFAAAADKAIKAVFPDQGETQPFLRLIGFGKAWPAMTEADRRGNADAVRAAITWAVQVMGGDRFAETEDRTEPAEPAWKSRADIGG